MIIGLFSNCTIFWHASLSLSLSASSSCTSIISLADKYFAHKNQITLLTSYRDQVLNVTVIEHQLIPQIACDWLFRNLLRVTSTTSTTNYRKKNACLTQKSLCRKQYLLHIRQTEICHIYIYIYIIRPRLIWVYFLDSGKSFSLQLPLYLHTTRFAREFKLEYKVKIFLPHFSLFFINLSSKSWDVFWYRQKNQTVVGRQGKKKGIFRSKSAFAFSGAQKDRCTYRRNIDILL